MPRCIPNFRRLFLDVAGAWGGSIQDTILGLWPSEPSFALYTTMSAEAGFIEELINSAKLHLIPFQKRGLHDICLRYKLEAGPSLCIGWRSSTIALCRSSRCSRPGIE